MNNFLIDTHVFLWLNFTPKKLSKEIIKLLQDRKNQLSVSVISFWEIALKYQLGKLNLSGVYSHDLISSAEQMGIEIANISPSEFATFFKLPSINGHKDPFDRLIIWQCIAQNRTLVSRDSKFSCYKEIGLKVIS